MRSLSFALFAALSVPLVSAHSAFIHPSSFAFNVTNKDFPGIENRPVAPLRGKTFKEWWFHNHLDFPPNAGDVFELPAGQAATAEIACHKGATSYFATAEGGDIRDRKNPENPCPGRGMEAYHTNGIDDLMGCALAIAYKSDARQVKPEDFTIFSVNHTCVWTVHTDFQVPAAMPPCPEGGCTCAWFWIHSPKSGGEENYMNGFKCNVTGSTSAVPLAKPKVARRCGADPENRKLQSAPANCTYGAKAPFYWLQKEQNNVFEGEHSPPVYNDLYNFANGAQDDIFEDSYFSIPDPNPSAPLPQLAKPASNVNLPVAKPENQAAKEPQSVTDKNPNDGAGSAIGDTVRALPIVARSSSTCGIPSAKLNKRSLWVDTDLLLQAESDDLARPRVWSRAAVVAMSKRRRTLSNERRDRLWGLW